MHSTQLMDAIKEVEIDSDGTFKYILIKISQEDERKTIVRGYGWAEYHGI